jgi:GTPase SAR1 family protein
MGCDLSVLNKMALKGRGEKDKNGVEILDKKVLLVGLDGAGKTSLLI